MINLQMPKVLANIRLAIKERRLQAMIMDDHRNKSGKLDWEDHYTTATDCRYRMPNITHPSGRPCGCAIGVSIPNKAYKTDLEGQTLVWLVEKKKISVKKSIRDDLYKLQTLHDNWTAAYKEEVAVRYRRKFMRFLRDLEKKYAN